MKPGHSQCSNPDTICRARYEFLVRESRQCGLQTDQIERSAHELCFLRDKKYYLKGIAYKPTGVALGFPLPDSRMTARLWRIAKLVDQCITTIHPESDKTFAFVPPDSYHITLVNRSHFEVGEVITAMNVKEQEKARQAIARAGGGPVTLHLNGLILTFRGRLFVPGFAVDDRLYQLRANLSALVPELRVNVPITAHIKLGHLLTPLNNRESKVLQQRVRRYGKYINGSLSFDDVYTPVGRILLSERL
ncbi:MAG: hypothetical protein KKA54_13460 [Proteobacteria bacterium]|nr:hypothetical protein [Pseudomonadota bacterium]